MIFEIRGLLFGLVIYCKFATTKFFIRVCFFLLIYHKIIMALIIVFSLPLSLSLSLSLSLPLSLSHVLVFVCLCVCVLVVFVSGVLGAPCTYSHSLVACTLYVYDSDICAGD